MMEVLTGKNTISSLLVDDKYHIHRHLLLQFMMLTITIGVFFDAPDKLNISLNRFYGWIGYFLLMNMLVYVNAYVLFPRFLRNNNPITYIVSIVLFTLFSLFVMIILQEYFYDIAITHQEVSVVAVFFSVTSSLLAIFLFLGGISALLFLKHWVIGNRRIYDLKLATSQSELSFLKSQINPHFLFNMLNNANIMVNEDPGFASHILTKLNDLLQYQINDSTKDEVCLDKDITFLTDFLDLEKTRHDHFDYTVSKEGNTSGLKVPPLLFIPFIENAVKHNLYDNEKSYVHVSFKLHNNNKLIFTCKNSTSQVASKRKTGGLGLANIKRRLDLLFNHKYSLEQNKNGTEYSVELHLKL